MKYLLPCTCGKSLVVEVSQAGQMVTCACGRTQEAPTMRGIRALAPAVEENARDTATRSQPAAWSPLQGGLFVVGILLACAGLSLAAYGSYVVTRIDVQPPTEEDYAMDAAQIDDQPIDEVYDVYLRVREAGLGVPEPPFYVQALRAEQMYLRYAIAGAIAGAIGVVLAVSSFFVGPRRRP